jgi:hypothetical protein
MNEQNKYDLFYLYLSVSFPMSLLFHSISTLKGNRSRKEFEHLDTYDLTQIIQSTLFYEGILEIVLQTYQTPHYK